MQPIDDGERVEFVPWDQLRPRERGGAGSRQQLGAVAGALCVVLVVAGWWWVNRSDAVPPMTDAAISSSQTRTSISEAPPPTVAASARVTEADLRVIAPALSDRAVSTIASEFLRAYLSDETSQIHPYGPASTPLYVEWIEVISADVTDGLQSWLVTMRVGLLEVGDEPRRLPVSEYSVFVSVEDAMAEVSVPIRRNGAEHQLVVQRPALDDVPMTILAAAAIGAEEEILGGWKAAGSWYVMIRDERGLPVAVEVEAP